MDKNPSILITGCSSGIGLCAAIMLKKRGYRVFATARKTEDIVKLSSQGLESILLDINDSASIRQALDQVLQRTGGTLDALFNNAGYMQTGAVEDLDRGIERAQFETNVFGPMELTRLVLPVMRQQGHGRIIQNSSILGVVTLPYYGAYNASKFALEAFSTTLRQELQGTQIYVSIINPGPIATHLKENAYQIFEHSKPQFQKGFYQKIYKKLELNYFKQKKKDRMTLPPQAVVKKLIHALESPNPHVHYFIGWPAKSLAFLRRILPDKTLNWILTKVQ